ncbi:hypothetical protein, conserved [Eimeria maxima]|uniref:Uncharacterized protein n=1 Tax=Eimeria maxima TaxID=5804 RepID=U6M865_EIMMA|nr:hypothetical protein, conserved [Eimeria maxima]CDJ58644.1 hypothetical protein, conserved [Eimeria maxima]
MIICRFPAIDAHPVTQQLQKKLEKYQANCPKPPASTAECFQTLSTPLDLSRCTQHIESEVKQLQGQVFKQSSFLHLREERKAGVGDSQAKEEDPQHKLLRLQKEQQELLGRLDPKAFDPISNWNCPVMPSQFVTSKKQLQELKAANLAVLTSRVKLYEMVGAFRHSDQRIRALTQQSRRHHYMYSELQGPRMVRRCSSSATISPPRGVKGSKPKYSKNLSLGVVKDIKPRKATMQAKTLAVDSESSTGKEQSTVAFECNSPGADLAQEEGVQKDETDERALNSDRGSCGPEPPENQQADCDSGGGDKRFETPGDYRV